MRLTRLTVTAMGFLLATAAGTMAADADLRLVTAAADQDKAAVRALLKQGVNVNTARADGATALLCAPPTGTISRRSTCCSRPAPRSTPPTTTASRALARAAENASTSDGRAAAESRRRPEPRADERHDAADDRLPHRESRSGQVAARARRERQCRDDRDQEHGAHVGGRRAASRDRQGAGRRPRRRRTPRRAKGSRR